MLDMKGQTHKADRTDLVLQAQICATGISAADIGSLVFEFWPHVSKLPYLMDFGFLHIYTAKGLGDWILWIASWISSHCQFSLA
jgi:hypothetical protein